MKRLSLFLIAISISISGLSQSRDSVTIPVVLLDSIIDELIVKDGMEVIINFQKKTLTLYEHRDSLHIAVIAKYELNESDYKKIIKNLQELSIISESEKKDLERQIKVLKRRIWLMSAGGVILLILLI